MVPFERGWNRMNHVLTLLVNQIRTALEKLGREGVGYVNSEYSNSIEYCVDGRVFEITIKERWKG